MEGKKKKLLVFHQALAPYRIDLWNRLNELFDFKIYFMYENLLDQKFDQDRLKGMLDFKPEYLTSGVRVGNRAIKWGLSSIIKTFNPDIILSYEYSQTTISLSLLKKRFNFTYKLYSICDDSLSITETCSGVRKMLRNILMKRLDGLILINQSVADWYKANFGTEKKWIVLPIIAKEEVFRNNLKQALPTANNFLAEYNLKGKKIVFFIGRLVHVKGIDRLIKAFGLIHKYEKDAILVLVGDGTERDALKQLAIDCDIEKKVVFPGRYEGEKLMAWYNIGQIFVLASHHEPFGAVVNEALLAGATVLCSINAGASTLIEPGVNGNIFDPYNIDGLGKMISEQLKNTLPVDTLKTIRPSNMNILFEENIKSIYTQLNARQL